ncbi:MAG: lysophospholipid acyltransferase family protein [Planctomycetota bacterium]|jgi:KDO2-lipid IV(A) lauroyltransferase
MKKKKSNIQNWAEYISARLLAGTFKYLPLGIAVFLGRCLGGMFFRLDKRHRLQCAEAMQKALDISENEALNLTREMYFHLGTMLVEFPRQNSLKGKLLAENVDLGDSEEKIKNLLAEGNGLIFITGHIGSWEVCGSVFGQLGLSNGAIARPLDNPLIDNWVKNVREENGQEIWDKFGAMRNALRALKKGKAFGTLMDIDGGQDGVFNDFFGMRCSTVPTAADLAVKTGAPMMAAVFHRTSPMHFKLEAGEPFRSDPGKDKEEERLRLLQRCNDELEKIIRKRPEQWLWLHRRWKTQPKEK